MVSRLRHYLFDLQLATSSVEAFSSVVTSQTQDLSPVRLYFFLKLLDFHFHRRYLSVLQVDSLLLLV